MKTLFAGGNTALQGHDSVNIHIRWAPNKIAGCDVDCSLFLLNANGKVRSDADFIFYNQPISDTGAIKLLQSQMGQDCFVQLSGIPSDVLKIVIAITIHGQSNFSHTWTPWAFSDESTFMQIFF